MRVQLDKFGTSTLENLLRTGHWSSSQEIINAGLRVVKERQRLWNQQKRKFLVEILNPAVKEVESGNVVNFDLDTFSRIKARSPKGVKTTHDNGRPAGRKAIVLSLSTIGDLRRYWKYACNLKPGLGDGFFRKVGRVLESIERRPGQGKKRTELRQGLRSIGNYELKYPWFVVFYVLRRNQVIVLRVVHWTYDPPARMSFP